jgi:Putative auto-transporter adhesin, head GIN domain
MKSFTIRKVFSLLLGLAALGLMPAADAMDWGWNSIVGSGVMKTETRDVSGFTGIGLSLPAKVSLTQGEKEGVTIEAEDNILPMIETLVEDHTLKIRWKEKFSSMRVGKIKINVSAKTIERLAVAGSGDIRSEQLSAGNLKVSIAGSGDISIKSLHADALKVSISGSGDFSAGGSANSLAVSIAGSGNVKAQKLETKSATVTIAGSGDALVWATDSLSVKVAGSGDVAYYGDPAISKSVLGSGSLKRLGSAPSPI